MKRNLLIWWIRTDLRLDDQQCLDGIEGFDRLMPVVEAPSDQAAAVRIDGAVLDFYRASPRRRRFRDEGCLSLAADLRHRGSDLFVLHAPIDVTLPELAARLGASEVRFSVASGTEEADEAARMTEALAVRGIACVGIWQHTLIRREALPFDLGSMPPVFTDFRKRIEACTRPASPTTAPARLPAPVDDACCVSWQAMKQPMRQAPRDDSRTTFVHRGGPSHGLTRLNDYVFTTGAVATYKQTRNGMLARDDMTRLSPWLSQGSLSARRVHETIGRYERVHGANESTYWIFFELLWRDFFLFTAAHHGARLFSIGGIRDVQKPWRHDLDDFARWREGRTGDALVDAVMHELAASGFVSNRARQNAASFLIHDLGLDWRWGAAWFEHHLLDHDPASNYGNWQYIAGVGNDPRPLRRFDTRHQAERYDPQGSYRSHWAAGLESLAFA